jgi:ABC-type phosphate/phosphonate transport system permease subunit
MVSMLFIVALAVVAIGADGIAALTGHSPVAQFLSTGLTPTGLPVPPSGEFLFGTDQLGRDVLVRLAHGARISLAIGVVASLLAAVIGVTVGLVAGYFGGWIDLVLGRVMDLVMSIPVLLCMLSLVAVFGPSLALSLTVIVFFSWTTMGRVIRGQVLSLKEREFVLASRSMGAGHLSIMFTDILPNLGAPIIIYTTMLVPSSASALFRQRRAGAACWQRRRIIPSICSPGGWCFSRAWPCFSPPSLSTFWATPCATRSTLPACGTRSTRRKRSLRGRRHDLLHRQPDRLCRACPRHAQRLCVHAVLRGSWRSRAYRRW